MTIVFASNDINAFPSALINTVASKRRTAYVSEAFEVANGSEQGDFWPPNSVRTNFPEVSGNVTWIHFQGTKVTAESTSSAADGRAIGEFFDSLGARICFIDVNNGLWILNVDGNASAGFTGPMGANTLRAIDIKIDTTGSNTVFELYSDQVLIKSHTAASSLGNPVSIFWVMRDLVGFAQETHFVISEFIVADEDTRDFGLSDMTPDATGNHTAWSGDHVETGAVDLGRLAHVTTTGQKLSSGLSSFAGPASSALKALVVTNYASVRGGTVGDIRNFLRINSTDYDGVAFGVGEAVQPFINVFLTNPDTASDWDTTDFSGVEIGIESLA